MEKKDNECNIKPLELHFNNILQTLSSWLFRRVLRESFSLLHLSPNHSITPPLHLTSYNAKRIFRKGQGKKNVFWENVSVCLLGKKERKKPNEELHFRIFKEQSILRADSTLVLRGSNSCNALQKQIPHI